MSIQVKANSILDNARKIAGHVTSWADYSNALFDQESGLVAQTFSDDMERQAFYDTDQYDELYQILADLMDRFDTVGGASPKSGKFMVRLPKSLHEVLDIEAKTEGVSLNQLVSAKLALPYRTKLDTSVSRLVRAFIDVHDGYASDRVIVDPTLNGKFLARCRELGLARTPYQLNHALQDIRKSKKAKLPPTTKRTEFRDFDNYRYASEIAVRVIQRTEGVSLDHILCDPDIAKRFDGEARRLTDEHSSLKLRWAALNLRKTHNLKPTDQMGPMYDLVTAGPVRTVNLDELPVLQATYVFYDNRWPIYAGETDNLRKRITTHVTRGLADWIDARDLTLRYFVETAPKQEERLSWLRSFINQNKPLLNYQRTG